ncbi:MAG: hypothetical protein RRY78_01615 [Clostridia bacterium]
MTILLKIFDWHPENLLQPNVICGLLIMIAGVFLVAGAQKIGDFVSKKIAQKAINQDTSNGTAETTNETANTSNETAEINIDNADIFNNTENINENAKNNVNNAENINENAKDNVNATDDNNKNVNIDNDNKNVNENKNSIQKNTKDYSITIKFAGLIVVLIGSLLILLI